MQNANGNEMEAVVTAESDTELLATLRAGAALGRPKTPGGPHAIPFAVVPDGYHVQSLKDQIPDLPPRRIADVRLFDAESFISYVNAFKAPETRIFADLQARAIGAILDYHEAGATGAARWGQHSVTLQLRLTPEWQRWVSMDRKKVSQLDFAEFIEDNLPDIASPDGSDILQVSRSLEATKTVTFASGVRLDNGQVDLTYKENIDGAARVNQQTVRIPESFVLGLAPFEGTPKYRLVARLRYRIGDGGRLTIGFDLVQPEKVLEDAFEVIVVNVESQAGLSVWSGALPTLTK